MKLKLSHFLYLFVLTITWGCSSGNFHGENSSNTSSEDEPAEDDSNFKAGHEPTSVTGANLAQASVVCITSLDLSLTCNIFVNVPSDDGTTEKWKVESLEGVEIDWHFSSFNDFSCVLATEPPSMACQIPEDTSFQQLEVTATLFETENPSNTTNIETTVSSTPSPTPSPTPTPQPTDKMVFISSTPILADFGSLSVADQHCSDLASAASLSGTWKAIISNSTESAKSRISYDGTYVNNNAQIIANSHAELFSGNLQNAISYSETGDLLGAALQIIWTGSTSNGDSAVENCQNWTNKTTGQRSLYGVGTHTGSSWINAGSGNGMFCETARRVYCAQQ